MYSNIFYMDLNISEGIGIFLKDPVPPSLSDIAMQNTLGDRYTDKHGNVFIINQVAKQNLKSYEPTALLVIRANHYNLIKDDISILKIKYNQILPIVLVLDLFPENLIALAQNDIFVFPNHDDMWENMHWIILPILQESHLLKPSEHGVYEDKKLAYINVLKTSKMESAGSSGAEIKINDVPFKEERKSLVNPATSGGIFAAPNNPQASPARSAPILQSWCKLI